MEAIEPSLTPEVFLPADWQRDLPPRAVRSAASRLGFSALVTFFLFAHAGLIATLLYEDKFGLGTLHKCRKRRFRSRSLFWNRREKSQSSHRLPRPG